MRSSEDTISSLEHAKTLVSKMAFALRLHVPGGFGGGTYEVEQNERHINDWIDDAITRIKGDAEWRVRAAQDEKS